jgi:hypothetical protein
MYAPTVALYGGQGDDDRHHPRPVDLLHVHTDIAQLDGITGLGGPPEPSRDEPAQGRDTRRDQAGAERIGPLVDARVAADTPSVRPDRLGPDFRAALLGGNVADKLLHDVLDGHDPGRAAELIDDDGQMGPGPAEVIEQLIERRHLGDEKGRRHVLGQRRLAFAGIEQVASHVQQAGDVVEVIAVCGDHGQAGVAGQRHNLASGGGHRHRLDADPRRHHVADLALAESDHVLEDLLLLVVDDALARRDVQQGGQLALIQAGRRLGRGSESAQRGHHEPVEGDPHRADELVQGQQGRRG